ncbi:MAG: HEPN domain-containing protein [Coriobacteriia bacterium]|nr:HEPN domain-containing protein [Coriobacteriia bacterium]
MNRDFEKCLASNRIVKQEHAVHLIPAEIGSARNDLRWAEASFESGNPKWATIQAYYGIFHAARALLFSQGYREKSHFCLKAAIQALFVDEGVLAQEYLDDFDTTMLLRETADYRSDFSRDGAESAVEAARRFLGKAEELLVQQSFDPIGDVD